MQVASGWVTLAGSADGALFWQREEIGVLQIAPLEKGSLPRMSEAVESIVLGEQDRGARTVSFGDYPELDATCGIIHREEPGPILQGQVIGFPIVAVHVTPITDLVSLQPRTDVGLGQCC
jgi:hypothetical protein